MHLIVQSLKPDPRNPGNVSSDLFALLVMNIRKLLKNILNVGGNTQCHHLYYTDLPDLLHTLFPHFPLLSYYRPAKICGCTTLNKHKTPGPLLR